LKPVASSVSRRNTTAEVAISEILPITSVRAPRYFGGRSLVGARVSLAKGGRTDRWPQITAIQSRTILLLVTVFVSLHVFIACIALRTSRAILLGVRVLVAYPSRGSRFQWNCSSHR